MLSFPSRANLTSRMPGSRQMLSKASYPIITRLRRPTNARAPLTCSARLRFVVHIPAVIVMQTPVGLVASWLQGLAHRRTHCADLPRACRPWFARRSRGCHREARLSDNMVNTIHHGLYLPCSRHRRAIHNPSSLLIGPVHRSPSASLAF